MMACITIGGKHFYAAVARLIQEAINGPQIIQKYFSRGVTHMLPKGDQPKNYRPITCLPSVYKILTSTLALKINEHLRKENIMAWEQNECRERAQGSKELLIIDNTITKQAKKSEEHLNGLSFRISSSYLATADTENLQSKSTGDRVAQSLDVNVAYVIITQHRINFL